ncbi:protein-disulfide isomerase [Halopolyspora algeriensis]|uniref:Protein-disulfide isomerase n=1 Tax=Halopolyspora algeriensis TaxID=1500506 RepID=A0A368VNS4_9ACTN|nr:thioredoxin domain-containing protein [Halopolyspora algeriensis]RCW43170.1 protein-disulfide isomerase [Halopolyspora algeriensis]TQM56228.1 protein-disulfide isomerase [Halopolyspora algeriensis]
MPKKTNPVTQRSGTSTNIILTAIVLVVAVAVIGGVLLFNNGGNNQAGSGQTVPASVLQKPDSNTLSQAPQGAPTLVEFVDYQCPSCYRYYQSVTSKIEQEYQGEINFVIRNYPLDMHPLAVPAARAVEAAAMQGKFQQMYHKMFDNYRSWAYTNGSLSSDKQAALARFDTFAKQIGLDLDKFHQDMNSQEVTQRIEQDRADGRKAGVQGTPSFYLNGSKFELSGNPQQDLNTLRQKLDGALAK